MSREMSLNQQMDFDHPIRITEDGTAEDLPRDANVYAPEVLVETDEDRQITSDGDKLMIEYINRQGWDVMDGYSQQSGYSGPIMHSSEFIGGALESDIRERPGIYVACVVTCLGPEESDNESEVAGWIVCRKRDDSDTDT